MIEWYSYLQIGVAVVAGVLAIALGLASRPPSDLSLGGAALVELLLVVQLVAAIIAPSVGNVPSGNVLEFYAYLISALLIPPLAVVWALVERTRWSTVVVGVGAMAVAVMVYRMQVIWAVQLA